MKYVFWVLAPCLLIFGAFALKQNTSDVGISIPVNSAITSRQQLRKSFFEKREVLMVYCASNEALALRYKNLIDGILLGNGEGFMGNIGVKFKNADQLNEQDIRDNILFLVGTEVGNPILSKLIKDLPIRFKADKIAYGKREISSKNALLMVSFIPNPENPLLPMGFLTGTDEEQVYSFFETKIKEEGRGIFRQNLDFNIYKNRARVVMGNFDHEWSLDTTALFDFTDKNNLVHSSDHFDFISHQSDLLPSTVQSIAIRAEQAISSILEFLNYTDELQRMQYHIYGSAEEKGLITGNTDQAHFVEEDNAVHTVINDKYKDNFIEKENALVISRLLGASKISAMERGLPVYFTNQWQREGYVYWTARLFTSGNALSLMELLNNDLAEIESPLITDCLSASLVAFLLDTWGKEVFLKNYANWVPSNKELQQLEPLWQNYLSAKASSTALNKKAPTKLAYLKGFNFAHEGYSIYNGYASTKATEAINKQNELGSNALALIPYSYIQNINKPAPFRFSNRAGSENDESIVHSAYEAKQKGMFTLLKPQIFVGNSWPGDIEMLNQTDWDSFFDFYYKWIRHYAFLAEIHEMDALCIGVEFTKATLNQSDKWREMIRKTRSLFRGKLTYAANWGAEFENIDFWNELDFIGLNCYYPLSKKDNPTDEELKAKFDTIKTKINTVYSRFKKPIVFTEIGFRSINMPWKNPHAEGDDSYNQEHQQRCYEVVFSGIENEPWCGGILWWKFPSYLEYRGTENSAFTPNNKMAEAAVRRWFLK